VPNRHPPTDVGGGAPSTPSAPRSFVDLHCHTSASFDSLASPAAVVRTAAARGLTHLAITDHDRIDGALEARDLAASAAPELSVIVGEEIRTAEGDLIGIFLERTVPPGLPAADTIALVRDQGGLVGIPHPFDRFRGSLLRDPRLVSLASAVDWVEGHNARVIFRDGNRLAAEFATQHGLPRVAVSDAHATVEIGVAYTVLGGDPSSPAGMLAALRGEGQAPPEFVDGRSTVFVRVVTPLAKLVQRARGNRRVAPGTAGPSAPR
jgi:predicted metal-dependent phosphoesterase TrpH